MKKAREFRDAKDGEGMRGQLGRRAAIGGFFVVLAVVFAVLAGGLGCAGAADRRASAGSWTSSETGSVFSEVPLPSDAEYDFTEPLYATSAVLMDAASGRVLYSKSGDVPMAMASTTKIMTCILVLELGNPEDVVTVSSYAASMPKVRLGMQRGEEFRVGDLLYSLMLDSHNDSAVALAEYIGKQDLEPELRSRSSGEYSEEESRRAVAAFAERMNQKARELGCENTNFITPNGLDATRTVTLPSGETVQSEHCTTAEELASIMAYCVLRSPKREEFLEITRAGEYAFSANGKSYAGVNHNALLQMMDGALSGKTGFTNKAGYCYVGAYQKDGKTFTLALLACGWPNNRSYKWSDAKALFRYGSETYSYQSFTEGERAFREERLQPVLVEEGQTTVLGEQAYVEIGIERGDSGQGDDGSQGGESSLSAPEGLLLRPDEEIEVRCSLLPKLAAPVEPGTRVGEITYEVDGRIYRTETVVTRGGVGRIDLGWCLEQIAKRWLVR